MYIIIMNGYYQNDIYNMVMNIRYRYRQRYLYLNKYRLKRHRSQLEDK